MSCKERVRSDAMRRVRREEISVVEAAELMRVSIRQARRLWKRFGEQSDAGLVHRLRGRASNRRLDQDLAERIVKLHQERYRDFGPTLACEKLASEHALSVSPNTLSRLLKERGLWECRRRRGKHRRRRERRSCLGSMLQMDGSHHDWFEGRSEWCVLMVIIDDATSRTWARFYTAETTEAAMDVFSRWVDRHGIPRSVYVDRHSIYRDQDHPGKPTQFGRAIKQLGVELILANSPQAKGRVERRNAVFQDRLVKEMRLRNISSIKQANDLLDKSFLADLNRRYAVNPKKQQDLHRAVERSMKLAEILCVQDERVVGQDWCVRWKSRWLQIDKSHESLQLAGKRVLVKQLAQGKLIVQHKGQTLSCKELSSRPEKTARSKPIVVNNKRWKPPADHPWGKASSDRQSARRSVPCVGVSPATAAPARGSPPHTARTE